MKYLAIDLGTKTMGIAISHGVIATALETYRFNDGDFDSAQKYLISIIKKNQIKVLIIGYPKNMDNSLGARVQMVNSFAKSIQENSNIDIKFIDERLTTKIANSILIKGNLSRVKRKNKKDSLAAMLILETYLKIVNNK